MIGFESGERRLTARLLAGEFVRYRSRFPEEFGCTADLPADAFAEAVRRVALVAERGTPVQLSFAPGRVTVGAATQGQARARETVPADFTGDEPSIAFSPQYLLDGVVAATTAQPGRGRRRGRPGQAALHQPDQARGDHAGARRGQRLQVPGGPAARCCEVTVPPAAAGPPGWNRARLQNPLVPVLQRRAPLDPSGPTAW